MFRILTAFLCLGSVAVSADKVDDIVGKVVAVTDGDTIKVRNSDGEFVIRLEGIDAPERKQPFGTASKQALDRLVYLQRVRVVPHGKDRYGRTLGTVLCGEKNINEEMVERGLAWHYKQHSKDKRLAELEKEAQDAKAGLWADKDPVAPWEWRKREMRKAR